MGIKVANNAFGTLASSITNSATSITLTTGQGARFPTLSAGDYFYATLIDTSNNLEIVKCTARSTDVLTVTRAQENTTARAYSAGDRIEIRITAATFEEATAVADGEITEAKIASGAVTESKLGSGAVTASKLGSDAPSGVSDKTNSSTGYFDLPSGTTAQRPGSPTSGAARFNSTTGRAEIYTGSSWMSLAPDLPIVSNGLILAFDAANPSSYPGSGATIYDISNNGSSVIGTMQGSTAFVSAGEASYFNLPRATSSNYISTTPAQAYVDFTAAFFINAGDDYNRANYMIATGVAGDTAFRTFNGTTQNPGNANDWAYTAATTYYLNGTAYTSNITLPAGTWFIIGGEVKNSAFGTFAAHFGSGYSDRFLAGRIGCVFMYNRALSAAEQQLNFATLRSRYGI